MKTDVLKADNLFPVLLERLITEPAPTFLHTTA